MALVTLHHLFVLMRLRQARSWILLGGLKQGMTHLHRYRHKCFRLLEQDEQEKNIPVFRARLEDQFRDVQRRLDALKSLQPKAAR